jgi:hypothetical protein
MKKAIKKKPFFVTTKAELTAIQKHLGKKKIIVADYLDVVFSGK